jgi:ankyrin repeat protein
MDKVDDLIKACIEGDLHLLKKSIKNKKDLKRKYRTWPLVGWAIQEGHLSIVKYLVDNGVSVTRKYSDGFTPLDQAVGEGHKKIIAFLIDLGVDVNQKTVNGTPLHTASAYGKLEIAKTLVKNGADIWTKDSRGWTARSYAGYYRRKELVDFFDRKRNKYNALQHKL